MSPTVRSVIGSGDIAARAYSMRPSKNGAGNVDLRECSVVPPIAVGRAGDDISSHNDAAIVDAVGFVVDSVRKVNRSELVSCVQHVTMASAVFGDVSPGDVTSIVHPIGARESRTGIID